MHSLLRIVSMLLLVLLLPLSGRGERAGDHTLKSGKEVWFLTAEEGRAAILHDPIDAWFSQLRPLEMEKRMGRAPAGETRDERMADFRKYLQEQVLEWEPEEKERLAAAMEEAAGLSEVGFPELIPQHVKFVKVTGADESNAWYTRADVIFFPKFWLDSMGQEWADNRIRHVLLHECAHVWSRANHERRGDFYGAHGFQHIGDVALGEWLENRMVTNPDAPQLGWMTEFESRRGGTRRGILVNYLKSTDPISPMRYLAALKVALVEVIQVDGKWRVLYNAQGRPVEISKTDEPAYFKKLTANSDYALHPEEVLAENLTFLAMATSGGELASELEIGDRAVLERLAALLDIELPEPVDEEAEAELVAP